MTDHSAPAPTHATTVRRRILHGLGSQGYVRAVQILIRLAEVPLLLHFWGVQIYGEWLMLAAIPAYLAIGDGGFAGAASRDMSMRSGAGDRAGALAVFQSTAWLLCLVSLAVFATAFAVARFAPLSDWLGFEQITAGTLSFVLLVLVSHVLVGFQGGLINGGFWCSGRYPLGMALAATTQLIEFAAMVAAVALGGGPVQAALAYLAGRVFGTVLTRLALRWATPWLRYGLANASLAEIRRLAAPAFASLAFPLGNALNIQGMRLVVGIVLGPPAVAIFAPLRTLTRIALQPAEVVKALATPELARAFGQGDERSFRAIFKNAWWTSIGCTVGTSILLLVGGRTIIQLWGAGELAIDWPLYLALLVASCLGAVWSAGVAAFTATNRHTKIAIPFLAVQALTVASGATIGVPLAGLLGAGVVLAASDLILTVYVSVALRRSGLDLAGKSAFLASNSMRACRHDPKEIDTINRKL